MFTAERDLVVSRLQRMWRTCDNLDIPSELLEYLSEDDWDYVRPEDAGHVERFAHLLESAEVSVRGESLLNIVQLKEGWRLLLRHRFESIKPRKAPLPLIELD